MQNTKNPLDSGNKAKHFNFVSNVKEQLLTKASLLKITHLLIFMWLALGRFPINRIKCLAVWHQGLLLPRATSLQVQ